MTYDDFLNMVRDTEIENAMPVLRRLLRDARFMDQVIRTFARKKIPTISEVDKELDEIEAMRTPRARSKSFLPPVKKRNFAKIGFYHFSSAMDGRLAEATYTPASNTMVIHKGSLIPYGPGVKYRHHPEILRYILSHDDIEVLDRNTCVLPQDLQVVSCSLAATIIRGRHDKQCSWIFGNGDRMGRVMAREQGDLLENDLRVRYVDPPQKLTSKKRTS